MPTTYDIRRRPQEIEDVVNKALICESEGHAHTPGGSYEAGVAAALRWVFGDSDDNPMDEVDHDVELEG